MLLHGCQFFEDIALRSSVGECLGAEVSNSPSRVTIFDGINFQPLNLIGKIMRRFVYGSLATLVLAASTLYPGFAAPAPQFPITAPGSMTFNFTAPFISSSGLLNESHVIQVMVVGMSLEDLMISIPPEMAKFNRVQITDGAGKEIPAKITASKERVAIAFDQPVASGTLLQVSIVGVQTEREMGDILLYGVTAKRMGLQGEIPIGTARIQIPFRG